jgi:polyketide cyclase/dehydrase/lipid transport protein
MRPLVRLVLGLVGLVAILAAVAVGLPAHVTVARTVVINAPESAVFPYVNNLHRFGDWSPWKLRDPQLAITYGGPEEGKGALIQWTSQKPSIGTGNMQISDSNLNRSVELAANFNNLEGTSSFEIAPSGSGSKITWSFGYDTGSSPLKRWKALMLDGFIGSEYRAGLDRLKETVEADRRPLTSPTPSVTPAPSGVSSQPEQPSGALPGGVAGAPVPPGGTTPSGQPGQAAPGAPAAPATGSQTAGTPSSPQTGATTTVPETTAPAPAPPPKKKRRRNQ